MLLNCHPLVKAVERVPTRRVGPCGPRLAGRLRHLWLLLVWSVLWGMGLGAAMAEDFLPPEKAFALTTSVVGERTLHVHWDIAPGYHLYQKRISLKAAPQPGAVTAEWKPLQMPPAEMVWDANFNEDMAVYQRALDLDVDFTQGTAPSQVVLGWQGCADAGLCYPPVTQTLQVSLAGLGAATPGVAWVDDAADADTVAAGPATSANGSSPAQGAGVAPSTAGTGGVTDGIASTLASGSLIKTMGVFLGAGLLLAFTPCVLPMVPILSSLIAGQSGPVNRRQGFLLSLSYSLGMALVYAAFGVAAGLAGEGLAAALQNPWVLGAFALMLSAMALSMFGVYELQMPSAIQGRATDWSNRLPGGSMAGVFLMGGISALVVGPCVAAPLAGALVYISQTRDVVLGGAALFAMAMGMSVPLLLVGVSAGSLLPRAGAWMERVKQVFGMMLLGVAIWMVSPVLPAAVHMLLWAIWLLAGAALLGVFGTATPQHARPPVPARAVGTSLVAVAALLLVGAASGGQSVLQPLAHLKPMPTAAGPGGTNPGANASAHLTFERVATVQALDAALRQAQQDGQAVMLDFYADWCVACKELETFTFSDPTVQQRLKGVRLLQADVTANTAQDKALMKRFGLFGPPGMVVFTPPAVGSAGEKVATEAPQKIIGFQNANDFTASLNRMLPAAL